MGIKEACKLYLVTRQQLAGLCEKGEFGAEKRAGRWVLTAPPITEQCIGPKAISEALGVSRQYVRQMCREKRVLSVRIGRHWRIGITDATRLIMLRLGGHRNV